MENRKRLNRVILCSGKAAIVLLTQYFSTNLSFSSGGFGLLVLLIRHSCSHASGRVTAQAVCCKRFDWFLYYITLWINKSMNHCELLDSDYNLAYWWGHIQFININQPLLACIFCRSHYSQSFNNYKTVNLSCCAASFLLYFQDHVGSSKWII